jgi:hypothetical protein
MKRGKGGGRQGGTVREEETSARSRGGRDECKESRRKRQVQGVEEEETSARSRGGRHR